MYLTHRHAEFVLFVYFWLLRQYLYSNMQGLGLNLTNNFVYNSYTIKLDVHLLVNIVTIVWNKTIDHRFKIYPKEIKRLEHFMLFLFDIFWNFISFSWFVRNRVEARFVARDVSLHSHISAHICGAEPWVCCSSKGWVRSWNTECANTKKLWIRRKIRRSVSLK